MVHPIYLIRYLDTSISSQNSIYQKVYTAKTEQTDIHRVDMRQDNNGEKN